MRRIDSAALPLAVYQAELFNPPGNIVQNIQQHVVAREAHATAREGPGCSRFKQKFKATLPAQIVLDARRQGQPTPTAISTGVRTTGRLITTAAALLIVVFIGFAAGDLLIIKQLGVGLIIAVALDATLVRLVLVPATLALLGQTNWWMPVFLRRLHRRLPRAHDHTATGIVFVDSATPSTDTP